MQPKVSVIVPVYKVENYLTQCLDSICTQTLKDIEVIVIDEGDHDRCREIIDYFESIDDRIVAVHEKQGGYGNSVNAGFVLAKGEYISIIESDDFIESDMLEKLYAQITRFDADIVKSPYYEYRTPEDETILPLMRELILQLPENKAFNITQYPILFSTHPSIWAGLYKADWLNKTKIQFLPKGAYLDIKFRFETFFAAKKICWINKPFYHWRVTNPTSTNASWDLNAAIERWDFIHTQFEDKKELWNSLATYMLPEENLNLFINYRPFCLSREQKRKIKRYLSLYPMNSIRYNPYVDSCSKKNLLSKTPSVMFMKRCLQWLYTKTTSMQVRRFSYRAFIVFGVSAVIFDSLPCSSTLFSAVKFIADIIPTLSFVVFVLFCLLLFAVQFFKIAKRVLKV